MTPCFAIIDKNTLTSMALRNMLLEIYYGIEVLTYNDMEAYIRDSDRHFLHFFVSSETLFSEMDEFITLKQQTTVLSLGQNRQFESIGFNILDLSLPEESIRSRLTHLQLFSIYEEQSDLKVRSRNGGDLSRREKEVLTLIVKGFINKEIAEHLKISLATVIFHRNNICEKLQTRSIGKLTVFAVLSGIVDINEI